MDPVPSSPIQHPVSSIQYPISSIQYPVSSIQYPVSSSQATINAHERPVAEGRRIAATNRDLDKLVEEKDFREDLYYRLNVFPLSLPPLRGRSRDIAMIVRHFVEKYSKKIGKQIDTIPQKVMAALQAYDWPGNARELENVLADRRATRRSPAARHESEHAAVAHAQTRFGVKEI